MMVFFDIDDTLLAHSDAEKSAALLFLKRFSQQLAYKEEEFCKLWTFVMEKHFNDFLAGKISFVEQRRRRIKEIFQSPHMFDKETDERFEHYLQYYEKSWNLFDDVLPCLDALKVPLGIISNGNSEQQLKKLKSLNIQDRFEVVVISSEVGHSKPRPEIFLEACRRAKIQPQQCLYVGDRLDIDALASKKVGMRGIWLNRKEKQTQGEGLEIITSLRELVVS